MVSRYSADHNGSLLANLRPLTYAQSFGGGLCADGDRAQRNPAGCNCLALTGSTAVLDYIAVVAVGSCLLRQPFHTPQISDRHRNASEHRP